LYSYNETKKKESRERLHLLDSLDEMEMRTTEEEEKNIYIHIKLKQVDRALLTDYIVE
jgi:hypothetical protein